MSVTELKHDGKPIILMDVPEGEVKPNYLMTGKKPVPYVRRNSSDIPMRPDEIGELYRQQHNKVRGPFE